MKFMDSVSSIANMRVSGFVILTVVFGLALSLAFKTMNWLLVLVVMAAVTYVFYRYRERLLFQVTDRMFKYYYLVGFLIMTTLYMLLVFRMIRDPISSWLAVIIYFLSWTILLVYAGKAQIGATFIKEPGAMLIQRGGMFLRIAWVKKGHRMLTNQAAQRLNALAFLFNPTVEDHKKRIFVKWLLFQLEDALDEKAHLIRGWDVVTTFGGDPFVSESARERTAEGCITLSTPEDVYNMIRRSPQEGEKTISHQPPYSRPRFSHMAKRPSSEIDEILRALSVVSGSSRAEFQVHSQLLTRDEKREGRKIPNQNKYVFNPEFTVGYRDRFAQYDIMTETEIAHESGLTPGIIKWCMADVAEQQKPRKGVFGGLRVIGFPWDSVMTHQLVVETWSEVTDVTEGGAAYKVEKVPREFQRIGLGREQMKLFVKRAETADGYAVDFYVVIFLHLRNVYKAMIDVDDWHQWLANVIVAKIRELTRRLPIHAAIDAKEHVSECIRRGVHGEEYTLVPELISPVPDGSSEDIQKEGRPKYRIHVVPIRDLRKLERMLYAAVGDNDGAEKKANTKDQDSIKDVAVDETLLESILFKAGIVVDGMGVKDVIPSDTEAKQFIEALPSAIQEAQIRIRQGIGEAGRIEREIAALASKGENVAQIFQLIETTKSVPSGSTVVLGGGGGSIDQALLAQLLRDRSKPTGKTGGSGETDAPESVSADAKGSGDIAGSDRESGKRPERSRSTRKRS